VAAGPSFRLLGIPVRIDLSFFVIVALLGFAARDLGFIVLWVAVVTVSVLVHELGHGVAFRAFGKRPQILLQGMGGLTSAPGTLSPVRDIVVSLAGPLTGMVLIGLPALWLQGQEATSSPGWDTALRVVVFVNIAWSLVNLLPVLPLDGGRVAASGLHLVLRRDSDRIAHGLSVVVAGGGALWALSREDTFLAFFAGFFVLYNLSQLAHLRADERTERLGADPVELDAHVDRLLTIGTAGAERLVRLQADLHDTGRFEDAVRVGQRTFPVVVGLGHPGAAAHVAYNVACSASRAGRSAEALTWLETAVEHGFSDRDLLDGDPDLAPVRTTAAFEALRSRLS